jgi:hypothetical protein
VEKIIGDILAPDHTRHHRVNDLLEGRELFILLAAAWLHDIGMILPPEPEEVDEARRRSKSLAEVVRERHNLRIGSYIQEHAAHLGLATHEATLLVLVCGAHRGLEILKSPDLAERPHDTRFLAAVLRAADELDISAARTPPEVAEVVWASLDAVGKWHWLKHMCIPLMEHSHDERIDSKPRVLSLSYDICVSLPSIGHLPQFRDRVMRPIQEVVQRQDVNLVLRQKGLEISCERFQWSPLLSEHFLPKGIVASRQELDSIITGSSDIPEILAARGAIEELGHRNSALYALVKRQFEHFAEAVADRRELLPAAGAACSTYVVALLRASASNECVKALEEFNTACRGLRAHGQLSAGSAAAVEKEGLTFGSLLFRAVAFLVGDDAAKLQHFSHLCMWLGADIVEVAYWIVLNRIGDTELRRRAIVALGENGSTAEHGQALVFASKEPEAVLRVEALRSLAKVNDGGFLDRLVEVLKYDLDGEVRRTASDVLRRIAETPATDSYPGCRVLLLDEEPGFVPPLVDALARRGVEVKVTLDRDCLSHLLTTWNPEVVVCELIPMSASGACGGESSGERFPGMALARIVRGALANVPIVVTSVVEAESLARELLWVKCVYVRKPTTIDQLSRVICSLLAVRPGLDRESVAGAEDGECGGSASR